MSRTKSPRRKAQKLVGVFCVATLEAAGLVVVNRKDVESLAQGNITSPAAGKGPRGSGSTGSETGAAATKDQPPQTTQQTLA